MSQAAPPVRRDTALLSAAPATNSAMLREILGRPGVMPALPAAQASFAVMVAVMTLTGAVVVDRHHEGHHVFPVIGAHVVAMYALVIVVGDVIDRIGRTTALPGGLLLPETEALVTRQVELIEETYGTKGRQVITDAQAYADGMTASWQANDISQPPATVNDVVAVTAGLAMYMLIGRTEDYAWSLTSAGHDVRDVYDGRREQLRGPRAARRGAAPSRR